LHCNEDILLISSTDKFKSEYLYNIKHSYGEVGGDANRRGKGYTPYSCQKLLTEALPSSGQSHGCPYRTYTPDNLSALLQSVGVSDQKLLRDVREDVGKQRFHIACNKVFEAAHKPELKKVLYCVGRGLLFVLTSRRYRIRNCGQRASWTLFSTRTHTSSAASYSRTWVRYRVATSVWTSQCGQRRSDVAKMFLICQVVSMALGKGWFG